MTRVRSSFSRYISTMALAACAICAPVRADLVLLGSDYLETMQPTFFMPLGVLNPLAGLALGPGSTDTIVRRKLDCSLSLNVGGSSCVIPIEMVALSLVSTVDPMVRVRESPTSASLGQMAISSDGSGGGGTFDSFFDIFVEISLNGGSTWGLPMQVPLMASATPWTTNPVGIQIEGLLGDQDANQHTDKNGLACPNTMVCVDFFIAQTVTEQHPGIGVHTAQHAVAEPSSLALTGLALSFVAWSFRRKTTTAKANPAVGSIASRSGRVAA